MYYIRSLHSVFTDFIARSIGKYIPYTRIGINSIYILYYIAVMCVHVRFSLAGESVLFFLFLAKRVRFFLRYYHHFFPS